MSKEYRIGKVEAENRGIRLGFLLGATLGIGAIVTYFVSGGKVDVPSSIVGYSITMVLGIIGAIVGGLWQGDNYVYIHGDEKDD